MATPAGQTPAEVPPNQTIYINNLNEKIKKDERDPSARYVPVQAKQLPKSRNPQTADSKFWRQFKSKVAEQQISAVTAIHFCPAPPHDFAVTSSTRVVIYDGVSCEVKKTISKFKDLAYSGNFRCDGQLIIAGGETGIIQVFDAGSRTVLRQLKGHSRSVRWVRYSDFDKLHVLSGSDDNTVRWWDVASQETIVKFQEHSDYVRCGAFNPASQDIWATGSYDHTVRIWDTRSAKSIYQLQHGKPLEDVMFFPSGGLLATAGGNAVKIWDIIGGGKLLHVLGNHQKTVTKLALTTPSESGSVLVDGSSRLLTASLDGHLKVFDTNEFKVAHIAKYPGPILSMDVSSLCTTLAVGSSSGLLSVRQRKPVVQEKLLIDSDATKLSKPRRLGANNFRYFLRGRGEKASDEDYVLARSRRPPFGEHDKLLRQFRYKDSLVAALRTRDPAVIVALMEELVARKGLISSFSNLEVSELEIMLAFLSKYITLPKYSRFLVPITHNVLDTCAVNLGASQSIKEKVMALKDKVQEEMKLQAYLQSFQGMLQTLIQASVY